MTSSESFGMPTGPGTVSGPQPGAHLSSVGIQEEQETGVTPTRARTQLGPGACATKLESERGGGVADEQGVGAHDGRRDCRDVVRV